MRVESRESRVESKVNVKSELWGLSCKARVISEEGPIIIGSYHKKKLVRCGGMWGPCSMLDATWYAGTSRSYELWPSVPQ